MINKKLIIFRTVNPLSRVQIIQYSIISIICTLDTGLTVRNICFLIIYYNMFYQVPSPKSLSFIRSASQGKNVSKTLISSRAVKSFVFRIFRPFQNYI